VTTDTSTHNHLRHTRSSPTAAEMHRPAQPALCIPGSPALETAPALLTRKLIISFFRLNSTSSQNELRINQLPDFWQCFISHPAAPEPAIRANSAHIRSASKCRSVNQKINTPPPPLAHSEQGRELLMDWRTIAQEMIGYYLAAGANQKLIARTPPSDRERQRERNTPPPPRFRYAGNK
jgi:hypothetical protein